MKIENSPNLNNKEPGQVPESAPESLEEQVTRLKIENEALRLENKTLKEENAVKDEKIEILEEAHGFVIKQLEDTSRDAFYDKLTGLMNRRTFDLMMKGYFERIYREPFPNEGRQGKIENKESLVLVMFDIDHFKKVNDGFGHDGGDLILETVSGVIKSHVRGTDFVARWGGEEIAVVFIGLTLGQVETKINFIREKIKEMSFSDENADIKDFHVTVSASLAHSADFKNEKDLFKAVDEALYNSKKTGRDKVTAYSVSSKEKPKEK